MLRRSIRRYSLKPRNVWHSLDAWTYGLNTESTYNWTSNEWSVPINLTATKLTKFGNQPISIGGGRGIRYWAESSTGGPESLGARAILTFLFPTRG
jgi:hypothetical protein